MSCTLNSLYIYIVGKEHLMSAVAQPKSEELLKELNDFLVAGKIDDFSKHRLKRELEKLIAIDPVIAHSALAIIASRFDSDEALMRKHMSSLLEHDSNNPMHLANYADCLLVFGQEDEATQFLKKAIDNIETKPKALPFIAKLAHTLNEEDVYFDIIKKAEQLNVYSPEIVFIASEVMLANCDSEDEEMNILNKMFPGDSLEKNALPLSNEDWKNIVQFAEELKEYE